MLEPFKKGKSALNMGGIALVWEVKSKLLGWVRKITSFGKIYSLIKCFLSINSNMNN